MSMNFYKSATSFRVSLDATDLVGDDLTATVTAATVTAASASGASLPIYIGKVSFSTDVAGLFSIVDNDSPPKVIEKYRIEGTGGIIRLNESSFNPESDYAPGGQNLIVKFEGDSTPTNTYLDIVAYAFA